MSSEVCSPLLKLPRELRDEIYKYVLYSTKVCDRWPRNRSKNDKKLINGARNTLKRQKSILLTCRQIYNEASKIFYQVNIFHYNFTSQFPEILGWRRRFCGFTKRAATVSHFLLFLIPFDKVAYITHVVLEVSLPRPLDTYIPFITRSNSSKQRNYYDFIRSHPTELLGMLDYLVGYAENLKSLELKVHNLWRSLVVVDRKRLMKNIEEDLPGQIIGMSKLKRLGITVLRHLEGEGGEFIVQSFKTCARTLVAQGGWAYLDTSIQRLPPEYSCGREAGWMMRR